MLQVFVVGRQQARVIVDVVSVVAGIFCVDARCPSVEELVGPLRLNESVAIPQAFSIAPHVVDYGSWNTAFRVVVICVEFPVSQCAVVVVKADFGPDCVDVAVVACCGGVVCHGAVRGRLAVAEFVAAVAVYNFGVHRQTHVFRQFNVNKHRRVDERETAGLHACAYVRFPVWGKFRPARGEIDIAGAAEFARRLQYIAFLAVEEADFVDVLERELSEIHLPVLGVAQLYAVVVHARVLAAHAPHVDGLDAANAAVVLYLHAGEVAYSVGYVERVHVLQPLSRQLLRNDYVFVERCGDNCDFVQRSGLLNKNRIGFIRALAHGKRWHAQQRTDNNQTI